jgi:hypothetical protein
MKVIANFYGDLVDTFRRALAQTGRPAHQLEAPQDVLFAYLNAQHRLISPRPRTVVEAPGFSCPLAHRTRYQALKDKLFAGIDVRGHQSKTVAREFDDDLLNDWGIQHLHLGENPDERGFVERGDDLLFVYVEDDRCLALAVGSHSDFADERLVERLYEGWPELFVLDFLQDVEASEQPQPMTERKRLRRLGLMLPTELARKVYLPRGGGCVRSGLSLRVVQAAQQWVYTATHAQEHVEQNIERYAVMALIEHGRFLRAPVRARFELGHDGRQFVHFLDARVRLELFPS